MTTALTYIYDIFDEMVNLMFNTCEISTNVTIGWIGVACLLFGMMIRSILNLPRSMPSYPHDTFTRYAYTDKNGNLQHGTRSSRTRRLN